MSFNTILIKHSIGTEVPGSLLQAELAYSAASGKLFIGDANGQAVEIGGANLVGRVGGIDTLIGQVQDLVNTNHTTVLDAIGIIGSRLVALEDFRAVAEGELGTVDSRIATAKSDLEGQISAAAGQATSDLTVAKSDLEGQISTAAGVAADSLAAVKTDIESQIAVSAGVAADSLTAAVAAQSAVNSDLSAATALVAQDLSDFETETATALGGLQSQIDQTASGALAALVAKDIELKSDIDAVDVRVSDIRTLLNDGSPTFNGLTVTGDLVVQGQTVSVDSEVTTIKDPVITLGEGSAVVDGMGRGVEYKYVDGAGQKVGFFGVDTVDGKFKFIPEASVSGNAFSGPAGVVVANVEGSATSFAADQVVNVEGEVTGTVSFNGTAPATLTVEVKGFSAAEPSSVVRRDADGVSGFTAVHTAGLSQMAGIDGLVGAQMSGLTNFVINGGEF